MKWGSELANMSYIIKVLYFGLKKRIFIESKQILFVIG